jgi:hypothetical protein
VTEMWPDDSPRRVVIVTGINHAILDTGTHGNQGHNTAWRHAYYWMVRNPPLVDIPRKDGKPPCGECHLGLSEVCDICGAVGAAAS